MTSPARTLADLSHQLPLDELFRAVREAQYLKLYDREAIHDVLTRRPSRALGATLPTLVTQSELEHRFLQVVAETDGWQAHAGPMPFQADRTHSNALQLAGWLILRFTWQDLTRRARTVAATVRAALAR